MSKWKKAISAGMSVALLASLFTVTAGSALAAATDYGFTVTGAGNIPTTGTSGAVSIAVSETQATGWDAAGNTLTFTLTDAAGAAGTVAWTGTPAISGQPGSLGTFTVTKAANVLTVAFTASNIAQVENFTISGMTIDTTAAAAGAVRVIVAKTAGAGTGTIPTGTGTASATINGDLAAGSTAVPYTLDAGSFPFAATDASNGNLQIAAPDAESRGISAGGNPLTLAVATGSFHADGTAITQSVGVVGLLTGVATVVPTLTETATKSSVFPQPGEFNNSLTGAVVTGTESGAGTLATNTVVTFTLDTAGVLFSSAPSATPGGAVMRLNGAAVSTAVPCALSFDRTSCSVTVTTKSTAATTISLSGIIVDIAASVLQGTNIGVNITTNPAVPVVVDSKTIATVARVAVGVAAQPTIYINENDQSTGVITITESRAGVLTDAAGNNYFGICLATSGETFTRAPWATVTTGDLKIRSGVVGATTVQGNLVSTTCVSWIVYSKSTVASTIEIRGADASNVILPAGATNGPRVSVAAGSAPGANSVRVLNGSQADVEGNLNTALVTIVSNAIQAFRNQPVVASVNTPRVPKGSANALAGCLTITETQAGQFKATEGIVITILPRSSTTFVQGRQDIFLKTGTTADLPLVTTNTASGLLTSAAGVSPTTIGFTVNQQATGTLGVITVCNIHLITLADASDGAILVRVQGSGGGSVTIDQVVSIGTVGSALAGSASSRLGVTQTGAFTTGTKVQVKGKYVTFRFDFGIAAAGQHVDIWGATKTGNDWSGFAKVTSRVANASGVVYYYIRQSSVTWKSYRANWSGGGAFTPARQARWR